MSLQQVAREVGARQRYADSADIRAAVGFDDRSGVALERVAESVVGGDEEPAIPARLYHFRAHPFCQGIGAGGELESIASTVLALVTGLLVFQRVEKTFVDVV